MWVNVYKSGSKWMNDRVETNSFNTDFAENEPSNSAGSDCAYVAKSAGYKIKTDSCMSTKPFFCMALSPNCPENFVHRPQYKQGLSCLKPVNFFETSINEYSFTSGNRMCQDLNTRMLHPREDKDSTYIKDVLPKPDGVTDWLFGSIGLAANDEYPQYAAHFIQPDR